MSTPRHSARRPNSTSPVQIQVIRCSAGNNNTEQRRKSCFALSPNTTNQGCTNHQRQERAPNRRISLPMDTLRYGTFFSPSNCSYFLKICKNYVYVAQNVILPYIPRRPNVYRRVYTTLKQRFVRTWNS